MIQMYLIEGIKAVRTIDSSQGKEEVTAALQKHQTLKSGARANPHANGLL